jgi:hypothetical protein
LFCKFSANKAIDAFGTENGTENGTKNGTKNGTEKARQKLLPRLIIQFIKLFSTRNSLIVFQQFLVFYLSNV